MSAPLYDFDIALNKAQKYCVYQERCQWDLEKKFRDWKVDEEIRDDILVELITQGFINEERFATQFVSGKFRIKQWGKHKIRLELKKRQISTYSINKALESITDEEYRLTLQNLIIKKSRDIKAKNEFEKTQKIAQYLYSKGYETELIWDVLHIMENE
ncbi:MAG: RecX family transcriptional regulator [Bacteroidales bacterium]|nr:RecX family transcriptional regulator [Bacteroidales bacterium]